MRRTKADAEETRASILRAAEQVFFDKGVSNATLEDVAKSAGVTRGAIYWHFANKSDLFLALHNSVPMPQEDMILQDAADPGADTLALIQKAAADWLAVMENDPQRQRILTILLRCNYDSELLPVLARQQEIDDFHTSLLEQAFQAAAEKGRLSTEWTPQSAARALRWMMKGLCSEWLLFGHRFGLAAQGGEGLEQLFSCFRTRP